MNDLSPIEAQLLALISDEERSGREVAMLYKQETGRSISYGTLYTTFRRLKERGLVRSRDGEDEDGRLRYFKITGEGRFAKSKAHEFYEGLAILTSPSWRPA